MKSYVFVHVGLLAKIPSANVTIEWLVSSVNPTMVDEVVFSIKLFHAVRELALIFPIVIEVI
jgi:hypothetical protein